MIVPQSGLTNRSAAKTFSFVEPSNTAAFAVKGFESNAVGVGGIQLRCVCDRPGSPWNFVSQLGTGWVTVSSINPPSNTFPSDWYSNQFSGNVSAQVYPTSLNSLLSLNTNSCGAPVSTEKLRASQSTTVGYWSLRKLVTQARPCGTYAPTFLPTQSPTRSPISSVPTKSPTSSPTTSAPSYSPSVKPTSKPSSTPTASPATSRPSVSPSKSPSTSVPTSSPTPCTPGIVTCCVSSQVNLHQLHIWETNKYLSLLQEKESFSSLSTKLS
jgi:hypothetical protein